MLSPKIERSVIKTIMGAIAVILCAYESNLRTDLLQGADFACIRRVAQAGVVMVPAQHGIFYDSPVNANVDYSNRPNGEIYCTMKTKANGENCCKSCQFSPFQIAQCVDSDTFDKYLEMMV